jgi:hypothetical protein
MNILSYFYQLLSKFDLKGVKGKELELFNILGSKLYTISSYHYNKVKKLEAALNLISKDSYYSEENNLYRFLQIFHFNSKSEKNQNGNKIIVNYYNIIKKEIYFNLEHKIEELIFNIYFSFFGPLSKEIYAKPFYRKICNETTKHILLNQEKKIIIYNDLFSFSDFLYLEYKEENLSKFSNKTGLEIELKDGDEINLKIENELYKEIINII